MQFREVLKTLLSQMFKGEEGSGNQFIPILGEEGRGALVTILAKSGWWVRGSKIRFSLTFVIKGFLGFSRLGIN